jgi:TonB family protein
MMAIRPVAVVAGSLWVVSLMAGVWVRGQGSGGKYHAAGIAQAGDIAYPMNSSAPGFVTLDVSLNASGAVQSVSVVRDVPPLTSAAQSAVKGWQFMPAMVDGQGVAGVVRVNVAFNPYNPEGVGLPGESLQAPRGGEPGKFQPAGVTTANYARYPPNTVTSGTVVLRVHVGHDGKGNGVIVVRGKGPLSGAATEAAKTWAFTPAMYGGKAVASDVVVVYVFAAPQAGTR